jgi:hypothetical protein
MDVLQITPAFAYSYQCGSTLLTSYLPVYIYSISLQIISLFINLFLIFYTSRTPYPHWFMKLFPGIYWPSYWVHTSNNETNKVRSLRLIRPSQIITLAMNDFILFLSFGLCCPILCCYITFNLCLHLFVWLMLIGRFVLYFHEEDTSTSTRAHASPSLSLATGFRILIPLRFSFSSLLSFTSRLCLSREN